MFNAVAAATDASKVTSIVVGDVCSALVASAPATSVVYAGVPLSTTAWSNVTVKTEPLAVASVTLIGVVGCGLVTAGFLRRELRRERRPMIPAVIVKPPELLVVSCQLPVNARPGCHTGN